LAAPLSERRIQDVDTTFDSPRRSSPLSDSPGRESSQLRDPSRLIVTCQVNFVQPNVTWMNALVNVLFVATYCVENHLSCFGGRSHLNRRSTKTRLRLKPRLLEYSLQAAF